VIERGLNWGRDVVAGFFSGLAPYERVLDIGAGSGQDLEAARQVCPAAQCFAVEFYLPNVERLKSQQVEVTTLNLERDPLPYPDEFFDVILSNQTLEHVKEIFWILHQASRVLKVNGTMIIGVPNLASFHNRLMLLLGMQPTCLQNASAHVRGYTRHDLLRMFEKTFPGGYRLEKFAGSNFYPFPGYAARRLSKWLPNYAWSIFLLLRKIKRYEGQILGYPVRERLETLFFLGAQ
jgi:ubiquinone/menaquinone biosynthesis C-methylase UbiE